MSKNIQLVQEAYQNFGEGNIPGLLDLLTENVSWIDPGYPNLPYGGNRSGKKEVMEFFTGMGSQITFERFEPQFYLQDGNYVIAKGFFSGKSNEKGKPFESSWIMLWEIIDNKIKSYESFVDTVKIYEALN